MRAVRVSAAAVAGAAVVGIAWAAVDATDRKSTRPLVAVQHKANPMATVAGQNSFGGALPNGLTLLGDVTSADISGRPTTWLDIDVSGLPRGWGYTVAVGNCTATRGQHRLYEVSGILPATSGTAYRAGHLRLSLPNLPMRATDPTAWVTVSRRSDGRKYGGFTGNLLANTLKPLGPNRPPCHG